MRSAILSSIGGFFLLLATLCVLAPSKISTSPLVPLKFSNSLTHRAPIAVASAPLDFSRALHKHKKRGSKSGKKRISNGAIAGIIIAIIINIIIIIVLIFLYLKKRKSGGHWNMGLAVDQFRMTEPGSRGQSTSVS